MSNINQTIAEKLVYYRKRLHFTQEEVAERLGVTFQAVSKWETARSAPDLSFLPMLADLFGCSIDELCGRLYGAATVIKSDLPWDNDSNCHAALFKGHELIESGEALRKFNFVIDTEIEHLTVHGNAEIHGNVHESCAVNGNLEINGDILGECTVGNNASVEGNVNGDLTPANNASIGGKIIGDVSAGGNISIGGDVTGDCAAANNLSAVTVKGDCSAGGTITIDGNVTTESLNAGTVRISGNAIIKEEAHCGILECGRISEGTVVIHE